MHEEDSNFTLLVHFLYDTSNNYRIAASTLLLPVEYPQLPAVLIGWIGTLIGGIAFLPASPCVVRHRGWLVRPTST